VDQHTAPRSYIVDNGTSVVRRNRSHLKLATQQDIEPSMPASGPATMESSDCNNQFPVNRSISSIPAV